MDYDPLYGRSSLSGGASGGTPPAANPLPPGTVVTSDPLSATRVLCGALLLPTVSSIVGRVFFDSIRNNFQRVLVGGFAFVVVKGVLKIYFKQKQFNRKKQRRILDYTEENKQKYGIGNGQLQQQQQGQQQGHRHGP